MKKLKKKLQGWKEKLLSISGRVTLFNYTIFAALFIEYLFIDSLYMLGMR
jgi:hypothetical protein